MEQDILSIIKNLFSPFLKRENLVLYDMELAGRGKRQMLHVFIDKEGGINHNDCSAASRYLSALLDAESILPGSYVLEVSSPGLTRSLKKTGHFTKSAGSVARVIFKKDFRGPREVLGKLESDDGGRFHVIRKSDGEKVEFDFTNVASAKLVIDP